MNVEIERKFLIDFDELKREAPLIFQNGINISQGYIAKTDNHTVVRVRVANDKAFLTVKGKNIGATRPEFEYSIPFNDGQEMLETLCDKKIQKTRYLYKIDNHTWEIDVFSGIHKGLIIAEIELSSEDEYFFKPSWLMQEVTYDKKYYNSNLLNSSF
jgi:adenylate cyclase